MMHKVHICIQWVSECAQWYAVLTVWSGKGNLCLNLEDCEQAPEGFVLPGIHWYYKYAHMRMHKCKSFQYFHAHMDVWGQGQLWHSIRGLKASLQVHISSLQSRPQPSPAPAESLPLVFMYQTNDLFSMIQMAGPRVQLVCPCQLPLDIYMRKDLAWNIIRMCAHLA